MESTAINTVYVVIGVNLGSHNHYISQVFFREDKAHEYVDSMYKLFKGKDRAFYIQEENVI